MRPRISPSLYVPPVRIGVANNVMAIGNITSASTDPTTLVSCVTGSGRSTWLAKERDAPGLFGHIYRTESYVIPLAPETDSMTVTIFEVGTKKPLGTHIIEGRSGLNSWYRANVGHAPDEEPDGPRPILELIEDVAAHLLLRHFEQKLTD